jgi:hypothetical protein
MSEIMPGRLRAFLNEHLPRSHAEDILQTLDPLFQMTKQGKYVFSREVTQINHRLPIITKALTGISSVGITCIKIDDDELPKIIAGGMNTEILRTQPECDPFKRLSDKKREELTFALLHSFTKDLCASTNKIADIGLLRRPSNDLWWVISTWVASEIANDPLQTHQRHALKQLVLQTCLGWIPIGVHTHSNATTILLGGGRSCYIPTSIAP